MADEKILDNAVLRLAQSPKGRGLRVHEHADCLTVDVLRVLNERGWIEWRTWVRGAHGPELQLRDGSWAGAFVDWTWYLAEYTGDISPEIRLSRYKGEARASELRLSSGGQGGEAESLGPESSVTRRRRVWRSICSTTAAVYRITIEAGWSALLEKLSGR